MRYAIPGNIPGLFTHVVEDTLIRDGLTRNRRDAAVWVGATALAVAMLSPKHKGLAFSVAGACALDLLGTQ